MGLLRTPRAIGSPAFDTKSSDRLQDRPLGQPVTSPPGQGGGPGKLHRIGVGSAPLPNPSAKPFEPSPTDVAHPHHPSHRRRRSASGRSDPRRRRHHGHRHHGRRRRPAPAGDLQGLERLRLRRGRAQGLLPVQSAQEEGTRRGQARGHLCAGDPPPGGEGAGRRQRRRRLSPEEGQRVHGGRGGKSFKLFTDGETAWARDADTDKAVTAAMRDAKGKSMVVKGVSARGTKTTDTYGTDGFAQAYDAINQACGVKR
ncbi:invasion associated locus B family protein [Azospirillum brasilense]|uniref:invasion associated locus B family protein n=1 Tax=Azospirillum brasilense TaxID=192 RepID=UPI001FE81DF5|nr:invasion associated locus B family protein [Azospirillum brasilense]